MWAKARYERTIIGLGLRNEIAFKEEKTAGEVRARRSGIWSAAGRGLYLRIYGSLIGVVQRRRTLRGLPGFCLNDELVLSEAFFALAFRSVNAALLLMIVRMRSVTL